MSDKKAGWPAADSDGRIVRFTGRNHVITADGRIRHSVYFSITDNDWPRIRNRLESMLAERAS